MKLPSISIFGTGALGSSLALAFNDLPYRVASLFNRTFEKAERLRDEMGELHISENIDRDSPVGDLLFLTVSDDAIPDIAEKLAKIPVNWEQKYVVHCSGVLTSQILDPLKEAGAKVAAFHPLQTFHEIDAGAFSSIYFSVEGDQEILAILSDLAKKLGAIAVKITPEGKARLHAAAVVASNYLTVLIHQSAEIASGTDITPETARRMLKPLVERTVHNIFQNGPEEALTGPVLRGDVETVKRHLKLLSHHEQWLDTYVSLGIGACNVALKPKPENKQNINRIKKILQQLKKHE